MNEILKPAGDTLDNGACTPENHANNPENCTVLENGGTLGHMRMVRGGGIDIKGFLSSLCNKKSAKPSDTPSLVDVPLCTLPPASASKPPQAVPVTAKPLDMPSSEPSAPPARFLSLQAVATAAIEQAEPNPAIQQRLKNQYAKTLAAYHWMRDPDERHQTALNYLDTWLEDGYSQRIALDGICDDNGVFRVTTWRLIPADKPLVTTKPLTAAPSAPRCDPGPNTPILPGTERRAI